ncbi:hypothetical protein N3K66_000928 [Trichothecium roseum]|uniref:Uncharacterized protein n=1 Tax=Trichothecium roseum TaxID=47278 RepID=A0ACC0VDM8_9HYPO|nr:hypothetical protein N3K66_000928 [Trichothecium roseum]
MISLKQLPSALLALLACAPDARAEREMFSSQHLYDWGYYGLSPRTEYRSFGLTSPLVNVLRWDEKCDNGYYLLTPRGRWVEQPGPTIIDSRGNLVWTSDAYGSVTDLQMQTYNGSNYLTFWRPVEGIKFGFGRGEHVMLDESYDVYQTFRPVGEGLLGDLHEFRITEDGTALLTVYDSKPADLSAIGGPEQGWLMDSMFQELDIETGELLFEWRASEHLELTDTIRYFAGADDGLSPDHGYDFFHINSLDKDRDGNYIVSGRHTSTIHCISPDGSLLWTLGGKKNDFSDLSEGTATDFTYQHHVRIEEDDTISLFDNAKAERDGPTTPHDFSRGLVIQLDTKARTAQTLHQVYDRRSPKHAVSQGSAQVVNGGHGMIVDYGHMPALTEFDLDTDEVLCDLHVGPWVLFKTGFIGSYRAFKGAWVGRPRQSPSVYLAPAERTLYVSWNGATEVSKWVLEGAEYDTLEDGGDWDALAEKTKESFETSFKLDSGMHQYVRVAAVDKDGQVLKRSPILHTSIGNSKGADPLAIILWLLDWAVTLVILAAILFTGGFLQVIMARNGIKFRLPCRRCRPLKRISRDLPSLPLWGTPAGGKHELEPLYDDDDSEDERKSV